MPSAPDTALDEALDRANRCRERANSYRRIATESGRSKHWLLAATEADAQADAIMSAMKKEGNGHG